MLEKSSVYLMVLYSEGSNFNNGLAGSRVLARGAIRRRGIVGNIGINGVIDSLPPSFLNCGLTDSAGNETENSGLKSSFNTHWKWDHYRI